MALKGKTTTTNGKTKTDNKPKGEMSRASVFDAVKPRGEIGEGKYDAVIVDAALNEPAENGKQSFRINYEIASEGDYQGQAITSFYQLFEEDGSAHQGAQFLLADLVKLGYENTKFDELPAAAADMAKKYLGVVIQVKKNKGYTNAFLGGLSEGSEEIEAYKEKRGF